MKVSQEEAKRIAALSRIEMGEQEAEVMAQQLSDILNFVEKINELDTSGVAETNHTLDVQNVFHKDENKGSLPRENALAMTADQEQGYFKVPAVIE